MTSHLYRLFPSLRDFKVTSPQQRRYNCFAWAAGTDAAWWEPNSDHYWPPQAPFEYSVDAFMAAFRTLGYETCADGNLEDGHEKIAIYGESSQVRHMARQLTSGRWTSKLGQLEDIEHASPADLEGAEYGTVVQYMRRAVGSA